MNYIELYEKKAIEKLNKTIPTFKGGDTVIVAVKISEGGKERKQLFEGVVLARHNRGLCSTFTVRKTAYGESVERNFSLYSPNIEIQVKAKGRVRRSRLYYLRNRTGKSARIRERIEA